MDDSGEEDLTNRSDDLTRDSGLQVWVELSLSLFDDLEVFGASFSEVERVETHAVVLFDLFVGTSEMWLQELSEQFRVEVESLLVKENCDYVAHVRNVLLFDFLEAGVITFEANQDRNWTVQQTVHRVWKSVNHWVSPVERFEKVAES